jgi:hypothetical protein
MDSIRKNIRNGAAFAGLRRACEVLSRQGIGLKTLFRERALPSLRLSGAMTSMHSGKSFDF